MRRKHNLNLETANQRQRFSIRKLTVGAANVLLGTTFLFGAGQTVQADSVNGVTNGEPASAEVKSTDEEQTQSNEASSEVKDDQQKDASATDQSAKTVVQNENKENSSEVDKTKSTQEAAEKVETDADKAAKDVPTSDSKDWKDHYDATLEYTKDINADITYWDITNGMDHKEQLGKTDNDSDDHGKTGNEIHLNNNDKRISDIEKQGYVFVKSDFTKGDKYGTEDSHFNVYFKHGITPSTDKTKKEDVKSETTSVKRHIYYRDA